MKEEFKKIKVNYYHYFPDRVTHYIIDKITNLVTDELVKKDNSFYTLQNDLYPTENIDEKELIKRNTNENMMLFEDCILDIPYDTTHISLTKEGNAYQMLYKFDKEKDQMCYYSYGNTWIGSMSYHDIPKGSKKRGGFVEKLTKIEDVIYR